MKLVLQLFAQFFKIGLFTFGGGYGMIALLEAEFVTKQKLLSQEEFLDLVAIAESTPGPIAINCATYIGYRQKKLPGAVASTLGVCTPSFIILYLISLFFDRFLALSLVAAAFRGIQVCVVYLIVCAGWKLWKGLPRKPLVTVLFILFFLCMTVCTVCAVKFSSVWYILIAAILGIAVCSLQRRKEGES